jgi:uncharacterized HhH-GPD family protein
VVTKTWPITGDEASDRLLLTDALALLIGMLLDQQVPMEWAFRGPSTLKARLGGRLDAAEIVRLGPDRLDEIFREKPALHRYPGSMARRAYALCEHVVNDYGGDASKVWTGTRSADAVYDRLRALPGYGEEKSKILLAILVKRWGKTFEGFEAVADPFSDDLPRSAADVDSAARLSEVRAFKQRKKASAKLTEDAT